jgi:predicted RecA/RadA family phage recombinase
MAFEAELIKDGDIIDYTPSGAVAVGEVVIVGGTCFVAAGEIAAGKLGALRSEGVFWAAKDTSTPFTRGDACYWSASGNKLTAVSTDTYFGMVTVDAATADTHAMVQLRGKVAEALTLTDLNDVHTAAVTNKYFLQADGTAYHGVLAELAALNDVSLSTPTAKNVLRGNGTTFASAQLQLSDMSDVSGTTPTAKNVLRGSGTAWASTQLQLSDLSDVSSSTATAGNLLVGSGSAFAAGKLGTASLATTASGGEGVPIRIWANVTATGAEVKAVRAATSVKMTVLSAHIIAVDAGTTPTVTLKSGAGGTTAFTDAMLKDTGAGIVTRATTIVQAGATLTAGWAINADFSGAGQVIVVIDAIAVA